MLRQDGKNKCPVCQQPWKEGDYVIPGRNGAYSKSKKWPRHESCLMKDSRPKMVAMVMQN